MFFFSPPRSSRTILSARHQRRRQPAICPVLEILEDRCLLSAPSLGYSSYLPATAYAVAVDSAGEAFVAGNGYVAKLNAAGTAAAYVTSLTGSGNVTGIALDSSGDAYVTGYTGST